MFSGKMCCILKACNDRYYPNCIRACNRYFSNCRIRYSIIFIGRSGGSDSSCYLLVAECKLAQWQLTVIKIINSPKLSLSGGKYRRTSLNFGDTVFCVVRAATVWPIALHLIVAVLGHRELFATIRGFGNLTKVASALSCASGSSAIPRNKIGDGALRKGLIDVTEHRYFPDMVCYRAGLAILSCFVVCQLRRTSLKLPFPESAGQWLSWPPINMECTATHAKHV